MKSLYKIISKKNLIIEILSADITTDEYTKLKYDEFHDKMFNRNYNLISDFRLCENNFDQKELQNMINTFKENKGKINRNKSALIFSDISVLKKLDLTGGNKNNSQKISYFTDIDDAENWVLK
ncbi:MAG: hypothetical protein L3J56_02475 [Bacteroidales bacterium]|nr:hypothetical protein [Bacteroidales bacterium]